MVDFIEYFKERNINKKKLEIEHLKHDIEIAKLKKQLNEVEVKNE